MHISLSSGPSAIESLNTALRAYWPNLKNDFRPAPIQYGDNHNGYTEVGIIGWNLDKVYGHETLRIYADEPVISIQPDGSATAIIKRMILRYESKGQEQVRLTLEPLDLVDAKRFTALIEKMRETAEAQHKHNHVAEPA